jgi:WhiB family redox-sensing transcriptional regulator
MDAASSIERQWVPAHVAISEEITHDQEEPKVYRGLSSLWPEWHAKARCLGDTGTTFFGSPEPTERPPYTTSDIKKAKEQCAVCPVFETCLRQAINGVEEYGVWAGTTTKERQKYFRLIRKGLATGEQIIEAILERRRRD